MSYQYIVKVDSGSITVVGATTPSDDEANPTTAISTWAHLAVWDSTNSNWDRLQSTLMTNAQEANATAQVIRTQAYVKGWNTVNSRWQGLNLDSTGNSTAVGINSWATSAIATASPPTQAIDTRSLLYGWDGGSNYKPLLTNGNGVLTVNTLAGAPYQEVGTTANASNFFLGVTTYGNNRNKQSATGNTTKTSTCDSQGSQFVRNGAPDPAATTVTDEATTASTGAAGIQVTAKASRANVVQWSASNDEAADMYACIVNKAAAAVNGDPIVWSRLVQAGTGSFAETFHLPLGLSAGLVLAWSTTTGVITLPGAPANSNIYASYK